MIESESDFALVNVNPFKAFFDEFESYPARADAADGMPYDSLSDLEGLIDPPLKCLDPAWLTEIVREVEWFRTRGFGSGSSWYSGSPTATNLAGAKQPPVVLKAFLEEARRTVRGWAEAWESDGCPLGVVVEEGLPTSWTSLGAITMSWEADDDAYELPPDANDYELPSSELDPVAAYRRALAEKAVRDFLSIRLFDREMPNDDPSIPEFAWQETDDRFEEGDDQKGVSVKYLSRQLLAPHSDCEKATLMLVPLPGTPDVAPPSLDKRDRTTGQSETGSRYKSHDDCSDGCGTVHTRDGSATSLDNDGDASATIAKPAVGGCPPERVPVSVSVPSGFPVRYKYTLSEDSVSYYVDHCHDNDCNFVTYSAREFWDTRTNQEREVEWEVPSATISWSCSVPDFVEVEDAWVVMVALSRKLDSEWKTEPELTSPSTGEATVRKSSKGTYDAELFFMLVPAEYSSGTLTVGTVPDVPAPSGGTEVDPPDTEGGGETTIRVGDGLMTTSKHRSTLDAAEILGALGAVAKVKFRASVKED